MPQIFDNITDPTRLGPALQSDLTNFDSVEVATGYLDLRGWAGFADLVDAKPSEGLERPIARVLVGMVMPSAAAEMLSALPTTDAFTRSQDTHPFLWCQCRQWRRIRRTRSSTLTE